MSLIPIQKLLVLNFKKIRKEGKINKNTMTNLYLLCPHIIGNCMEIIDNRLITKAISKYSDKHVYRVKAQTTKNHNYTCIDTTFCTCPSFRMNVKKNYDILLCKHLLAVKLVDCLGDKYYDKVIVSEQEFSSYLKEV